LIHSTFGKIDILERQNVLRGGVVESRQASYRIKDATEHYSKKTYGR